MCLIVRAIGAGLAFASGSSQVAFAQTFPPPAELFDPPALLHTVAAQANDRRVRRFDSASRTRGLAWGWGHSWSPFFGKTRSHLGFVAFHPQMGWFLTDRI